MYTHRLFLKDGHTFMTDADRALMEQCKVDAQQSAAAAVEAATKAQEHAATIDTDRIDASIALKADNLYYDLEGRLLYLSSNGTKIGEGIPISANINSATLIVENTTGWSTRTISNVQPSCIISVNWSSVDGGVSTGTGTVTVKVENELRHSANIKQGVYTVNVMDYLRLGENRVDLTITDFRGNSKSILFIVSMYDPGVLVSTKLVERTLTGDYVNDRVTKVGQYAFAGLILGRLSLPNIADATDAVRTYSLGGIKADEIELESMTTAVYWMFNLSAIGILKLPHATTLNLESLNAKLINRVILNRLETINSGVLSSKNGAETVDCHKLTSLYDYPNTGSFVKIKNLIIRTPSICTLKNAPRTTAGKLYVPAALVDSYKAATNWSDMADRIFAIEDYPDICEVS